MTPPPSEKKVRDIYGLRGSPGHRAVVRDIGGRRKLIIWWVLVFYFGSYQKLLSKNGQILTFGVYTYNQDTLTIQYLGINQINRGH